MEPRVEDLPSSLSQLRTPSHTSLGENRHQDHLSLSFFLMNVVASVCWMLEKVYKVSACWKMPHEGEGWTKGKIMTVVQMLTAEERSDWKGPGTVATRWDFDYTHHFLFENASTSACHSFQHIQMILQCQLYLLKVYPTCPIGLFCFMLLHEPQCIPLSGPSHLNLYVRRSIHIKYLHAEAEMSGFFFFFPQKSRYQSEAKSGTQFRYLLFQ